jgi:hypothetical protein
MTVPEIVETQRLYPSPFQDITECVIDGPRIKRATVVAGMKCLKYFACLPPTYLIVSM